MLTAPRSEDDVGRRGVHPAVLLHVLPRGFVRIRYSGWMANRLRRKCAAQCRALLAARDPPVTKEGAERLCPRCGGAVETVEVISPRQLRRGPLGRRRAPDSS